MSATMKLISELSGVSRGTVDRVLNKRGRVSPETEKQVRRIAEQLGYRPNRAGKALAARKKAYVIGMLLTSEGIPFFDEVIRGVRAAEAELADYGVSVLLRGIKGYDSVVQAEAMQKMRPQVNALLLNPIDDPAVRGKIDELAGEGIPVITINTDIEHTRRLCYVGNDYVKSGEAACGMLRLMLPSDAVLGILTGSVRVLGHNQRITGFRRVMKKSCPGFRLADIAETNDDDEVAYRETLCMLNAYPEINGLYIAAAGTNGVCRAVLALGRERLVQVVSVDSIPSVEEMLQQGVIGATICQQPFAQGYQAVRRAFDYLAAGEIPGDFIVQNEIRIAEML